MLPRATPVFPTNDRMVDVLLRHHDDLSDHYLFPFPPGDIVPELKDKGILHLRAKNGGLNVPRSDLVCSAADLNLISDTLKFPVAVKPALPMMSFKGTKCDDLESLRNQVLVSEKLHEQLLIQDWIEGDDRSIVFAAYYIGRDGYCTAQYSGRKLLCYPPQTGHAAATEGRDLGR